MKTLILVAGIFRKKIPPALLIPFGIVVVLAAVGVVPVDVAASMCSEVLRDE